jgi:hypothetical protein
MDEVFQLADEKFEINGRLVGGLPVTVIIEEVDAIGRSRSGSSSEFDNGAIMDRVLTTLLAKLDPCRPALRDRHILIFATTNVPHMLDGAIVRRLGNVEYFGRLKNRQSLAAVLQKHVDRLPVASNNGYTQAEIWRRHTADLSAWLFSPNGADPGLVELTFAGTSTPVKKYRRDFLTPAIVARSVQSAAGEAAKRELAGTAARGLTLPLLVQAFDHQFRGLADTLLMVCEWQVCAGFHSPRTRPWSSYTPSLSAGTLCLKTHPPIHQPTTGTNHD